jgi:glutathione reductase (NADPH)
MGSRRGEQMNRQFDTRELGIDVQLGTQAEGVEKGRGLTVRTSAAGQKRTFDADMVVHAAGRTPEIDDLNLDVAHVEWDERGVKVNEFCKASPTPLCMQRGMLLPAEARLFTPVASYEGGIVASKMLKGNQQKPNYAGIPTVVFSIPPVASVGLGEDDARRRGLKFRVKKEMTSTWYSSRRVAEKYSGYKVLVEEGTDRILGAHLLGGEVGEVINIFALAIRSGIRATDFKHTIFSYPTHSSDLPYML